MKPAVEKEAPAAAPYVYPHDQSALCRLDDGPLRGLRHRTVIDGATGSDALALWQEEHLPGFCVPPHRHDCEEIITVLHGAIEATLEETRYRVGAAQSVRMAQSVRIPAWMLHGFRVLGEEPVLLLAIFASNRPRIFRADGTESQPPWEGGASDHLQSSARAANHLGPHADPLIY